MKWEAMSCPTATLKTSERTGHYGGFLFVQLPAFCLLSVLTLSRVGCASSDNSLNNSTGPWTLSQFPNPQTDPGECGRDHPSFVCDPDHILSPNEASLLDEEIERTCQDTSCPCNPSCHHACPGYNIAVAVVTNLQGEAIPDKLRAESQRWATHLQETQWNFGTCDEDVVIIISKDDEKVFTSTGKEASRALLDTCVVKVFQATRHQFRAGNLSQALLGMVRSYRQSMTKSECILPNGDEMKDVPVYNTKPTSNNSPTKPSKDSGLSGGAIAGIVIGAVLGAVILLGILLCCCGCGDNDPESNVSYSQTQAAERNMRKKDRRKVRYNNPHRSGNGWTDDDTITAAGYVAGAVVIGGASDWGDDHSVGGVSGGGDGGGDFGD